MMTEAVPLSLLQVDHLVLRLSNMVDKTLKNDLERGYAIPDESANDETVTQVLRKWIFYYRKMILIIFFKWNVENPRPLASASVGIEGGEAKYWASLSIHPRINTRKSLFEGTDPRKWDNKNTSKLILAQ